jgi:acyl-CoA synthetase (NDP forming)
VAIDALIDVLHRVSRLVEDVPEIAELDCNPVVATPTGAVVLDARIRVDLGAAASSEDTRHLR